jgi:hypothetical protein
MRIPGVHQSIIAERLIPASKMDFHLKCQDRYETFAQSALALSRKPDRLRRKPLIPLDKDFHVKCQRTMMMMLLSAP